MKKAIKLFFLLLVVAVVMVSCTQRYLFYPIPGWNDNDSDNNPVVEPEDPISERYPDSDYSNGSVTYQTADALATALESLEDNSKVVLSSGTYSMSPSKDIGLGDQSGWLFVVDADNVAIVAGDGQNVTIDSSDETPNGNWSSQNLVTISGDNAVLAGLNLGTRPSKNKSVEVIGNNAIIDSCTFLEDAVLYFGENAKEINNITVKNCTFKNNASLVLCNGVSGEILVTNNTFEKGSSLTINGSLTTGWNEKSVDLQNATFEGNKFETGSQVVLKYDESNENNASLKDFKISSIAENLGEPVKGQAFNESLNKVVGSQFTYTAI